MALLSGAELLDIVVMTLIVGYIFKDIFKRPQRKHGSGLTMTRDSDGSYSLEHGAQFLDLSDYLGVERRTWYDDIFFAMLVTGPAIVLHEFGHKFVAMAFGMQATFQAAYGGLLLGVFLKWFLGFIAFIPAYVSILGQTSPLNYSLIAFAGPGVNLFLWLLSGYALKKNLLKGHEHALYLTKQINKILFLLNMIPIPGFDGWKVYGGLFRAFLGLL